MNALFSMPGRNLVRVRSALAHFIRTDGRAMCGWVPNSRTTMLPEDVAVRGAQHCEACVDGLLAERRRLRT